MSAIALAGLPLPVYAANDPTARDWTASGGGVKRKLMPDLNGQPTVELLEVFSFDRHHTFCRVDTNPKSFTMPTHKMGVVSPNVSGDLISGEAGDYVVQVYSHEPTVGVDYELSLVKR